MRSYTGKAERTAWRHWFENHRLWCWFWSGFASCCRRGCSCCSHLSIPKAWRRRQVLQYHWESIKKIVRQPEGWAGGRPFLPVKMCWACPASNPVIGITRATARAPPIIPAVTCCEVLCRELWSLGQEGLCQISFSVSGSAWWWMEDCGSSVSNALYCRVHSFVIKVS